MTDLPHRVSAPLCPMDESMSMLNTNSTDVYIVAGGSGALPNSGGSGGGMTPPQVDPELALSGSGQSITIPDTEFFIIKSNCPASSGFRLLSLSLMVKGASNVLILVTGDAGTLIAQALVRAAYRSLIFDTFNNVLFMEIKTVSV